MYVCKARSYTYAFDQFDIAFELLCTNAVAMAISSYKGEHAGDGNPRFHVTQAGVMQGFNMLL